MLRFAGVLLALVLSQGWQWSRLLQERYAWDSDLAWVAATAFTALFLLQQWLLTLDEPAERNVARERSVFIDPLMEQMLREYYGILVAKGGANFEKPLVRVNVMLPVVDRFRTRKRLQIFYKACPNGVQYSRDEIDMRWSRNEGLVGWVWSRGQAQDYSASRDGNSTDAPPFSSSLSVPILQGGEPVGVLTLDSEQDMDRTMFSCAEVRNHLLSYAQRLPSLCFSQGVKP